MIRLNERGEIMNKAEKADAARMTREGVEGCVREMCVASVRVDEATAAMNEELTAVRARYEAKVARWMGAFDGLDARVRAWADAHPEEFATKRSIAMVHGTLGFRTGQPTLKPIKGVTWEKVLAALKFNLPHYVRVREDVDREALLGDREALGADGLREMGLRVEQQERFFVELNKESILREGPR